MFRLFVNSKRKATQTVRLLPGFRASTFREVTVRHPVRHRGINSPRGEPIQEERQSHRGFTLVELMAAVGILMILTSLALPVAWIQVKRQKETELRRNLRTMREAIDRYKDAADQGLIEADEKHFGYPPDLEILVKGVEIKGKKGKLKFLRKIPMDPMTGEARWVLRSMPG